MSEEELIEELSLLFDDIENDERYTDTIYRNITNLQQENKQLKENYQLELEENSKLSDLWCKNNKILNELEEYIKKHIEEWENDEDEYLNGVVAEDKDILQLIQELKEKYK